MESAPLFLEPRPGATGLTSPFPAPTLVCPVGKSSGVHARCPALVRGFPLPPRGSSSGAGPHRGPFLRPVTMPQAPAHAAPGRAARCAQAPPGRQAPRVPPPAGPRFSGAPLLPGATSAPRPDPRPPRAARVSGTQPGGLR